MLSAGGKYMLFSAFSNDGLGDKNMAEILCHSGFGERVEVQYDHLVQKRVNKGGLLEDVVFPRSVRDRGS